MELEHLYLWTDGSGRPCGPYGWAFILTDPAGTIEFEAKSGDGLEGSSQTAEVTAVLNGLKWAKKYYPDAVITVHTDSAYIVNTFKERWWARWKTNGFKNSRGKPIVHKQLWLDILDTIDTMEVHWVHVPGHSGIEFNEKCDAMAVARRKAAE